MGSGRPLGLSRSSPSCLNRPAQRTDFVHGLQGGPQAYHDLPVHSFRTLLADLGTLTANTMQVTEGANSFTLHTQPTPIQQRCFELLGSTPRT